MVIHSTTLDTMEKVIALYGGTTWVKIEGRMLLGQSSSHAVNSTGGSETNTLSVANLPSHSHSIPALNGKAASDGTHTHKMFTTTSIESGLEANVDSSPAIQFSKLGDDSYHMVTGYGIASAGNTSSGGAHEHTVTTTASNTGNIGSGTAVNNMPPYKTVYIWERTA